VPRRAGFQPVPTEHQRRCWCRLKTRTYSRHVFNSWPFGQGTAFTRRVLPRGRRQPRQDTQRVARAEHRSHITNAETASDVARSGSSSRSSSLGLLQLPLTD
jgi:hypothetical protein